MLSWSHRNGFNGLLVVAGLGFGIIGGAFSMVNVLADMSGPGTIGLYGDSSLFFVVSCEYQTGLLHLHFERDTMEIVFKFTHIMVVFMNHLIMIVNRDDLR